MKRPLPKRSNLFLMEMILAILFFSLAGTVCMQLFAKARLLSQTTIDRNQSVILAKNAAAAFEVNGGSLDSLKNAYPHSQLEDETFTVYYNSDRKPCKKKNHTYRMCITIEEQHENLTTAVIQIKNSDSEELFSLTASHYQPIKAGE